MKIDNTTAAVVTGGASGLGRATAEALAAAGVKVAIFDLNEELGSGEFGGNLLPELPSATAPAPAAPATEGTAPAAPSATTPAPATND